MSRAAAFATARAAVRARCPDAIVVGYRHARRGSARVRHRAVTGLRAASYRSNAGDPRTLVSSVLAHVLTVPPAGERRIEVGSGGRPSPGYIHVDVNPAATDLDILAPAHRLPFPDGWADELLSIHMIEHAPPSRLRAILREWARVLGPGGVLRIHTPNGRALAAVLASADLERSRYWAVQNALFGYWLAPQDCRQPEDLGGRGDHRLALPFPVLADLLAEAGFGGIRDATGEAPCYHLTEWEPYVPGMCLEVEATRT